MNDNAKTIKVGYLISYDYFFALNSLKEVYQYADSITFCYDKDFRTWAGNIFSIPDSFFEKLNELDVDNKISFYKDTFYLPDTNPMVLDTRQRQMLGNFMGDGGWHIQVDSDEYPYDFEKLACFLKSHAFLLKNPHKTPVNFSVKWINVFKEDAEGFYLIKPFNETCYLITNCPEYTYSRKTATRNFTLDFHVIHQSYARSANDIFTKLSNWSHKDDFDIVPFFEQWKSLNRSNYKDLENFHPLTPSTWEYLEFVESKNIDDLISLCKSKYPQPKLKLKTTKKLKLLLKSFI